MFTLPAIITFFFTAFFASTTFANCYEVPIISFDTELYVPESEETIVSRAQQVMYANPSIYNNVIWSAYKKNGGINYNSGNVRAAINGDKGLVYIDRFGKVRVGDKYGEIDAHAFEKKLALKCGQ